MTKTKAFVNTNDALDISGAEDAAGQVVFQLVGAGTSTIQFEASQDGTNFVAVQATNLNTGSAATSASAAGIFRLNVGGIRHARLRASAIVGSLSAIASIAAG